MVVKKILNQLTAARIKKEIKSVENIKLPIKIQKILENYYKISRSDRKMYVWKWLYRTAEIGIPPIIDKKYQNSLIEVKFLIFFFTGLLDDIADKKYLRNKKLLDNILKALLNSTHTNQSRLNYEERKYIQFTIKTFFTIKNILKEYPRYKEFRNIFEYDIAQLLNSIRYAYLVNENPYLINKPEYWLYLSHNMTVMINFTIDLMCSQKFSNKDLGRLREIGLDVQKMMRIANWLSTWEREFCEGDYTSGIFAEALDIRLFTIDDLLNRKKLRIIKKIKHSRIERYLLQEWEDIYYKIDKSINKTESANLKEMIIYFKKISRILLFYHLSCGATKNL